MYLHGGNSLRHIIDYYLLLSTNDAMVNNDMYIIYNSTLFFSE